MEVSGFGIGLFLKFAGFWVWAVLEGCWVLGLGFVWFLRTWVLMWVVFDEFWIEDLGWGFTMGWV